MGEISVKYTLIFPTFLWLLCFTNLPPNLLHGFDFIHLILVGSKIPACQGHPGRQFTYGFDPAIQQCLKVASEGELELIRKK